jgi:N-acetylneuraminate synthase
MTKSRLVKVGDVFIGEHEPVFAIADLGVNHNGSLEHVKKLIKGAKSAGCNAIEFQKRTPEQFVSYDHRGIKIGTPWGESTFLEYCQKMEFNKEQFQEIDQYCKEKDIHWLASCYDIESIDFIEQFNPSLYKIPIARLVDEMYLYIIKSIKKPLILSADISKLKELNTAIEVLGTDNILLLCSAKTNPIRVEDLFLNMVQHLKQEYPAIPIGYTCTEDGLSSTWSAIMLGATFIERRITLDKNIWGTYQDQSLEIIEMRRLLQMIRDVQKEIKSGNKLIHSKLYNKCDRTMSSNTRQKRKELVV